MSTGLPPQFPDDRTNPYAAPETEIGPGELAGYGLSPTPFTVGDVADRTWQIFKRQMWKCIGVILACFGLNFGAQMLVNLLPVLGQRGGDQRVFALLFVVATIALAIFQLWIGIGQALFMLHVARGRDATFDLVFQGGRYLLPVIVASLVFGLALAGVIAVGLIPAGVTMAATGGNQGAVQAVLVVGFLVALIAVIILAIRLSQFYYLIIDRDAGIMESLRLSLEVTRGNVGNILVLGVLVWLINIVGLLACGVGLIFTIPYSILLFIVTYLALTGQPTADPLAAKRPMFDPRVSGPGGSASDTF